MLLTDICFISDTFVTAAGIKLYQGQTKESIALNYWMEENTLIIEASSDPNILRGPPPEVQAQPLDTLHVASLTVSFLSTGTSSKHGVGVVIDTAMWSAWKEGKVVLKV